MISKINSIKVMKKQLFAAFIAIVFIGSNALAFYGPNDNFAAKLHRPDGDLTEPSRSAGCYVFAD
jgi:hypothetical protein